MTEQSRLEAIFSAARNLPAGHERDAYVTNACGRDTQLLQQVQDLLRSHEQSDGPLDAPPPAFGSLSTGSSIDDLTGTQIGRYKIREQIGEGGFGIVYVAQQQKPVRRNVALKIIKPGMDSKDVIARFEAEQQALALMDHPNVAKVLDAGCTENGQPYFVMELIHGLKITEFCDKNCCSTQQRLELLIDVCGAVQHAHHKAIIHRDIKPSNILVTLRDSKPIPKVIDFGVAKALSQQLTEKTIYTTYGQMIGTPEYMSPEQAEMSELDIDTRSDIYSLGVVLYELLVGQPPFEAERLRAGGFEGIQRILSEEEPPTPSTKLSKMGVQATGIADRRGTDVSHLSQSIRGDLDWIVMKAIEKDRNRRYESANDLALDLRRHLAGESVFARPQTIAYRLQRMWCRNRLVISAVGAVATALLLGTGMSIWQAAKATDASIAAVESQRQMQRIAETRRQELYAAQVSIAHQAWGAGDLQRAQDLLAMQRPEGDETDLRGFEWRYLWRLCQDESLKPLATLTEGTVRWFESNLISFSADGSKLAIAEGEAIRVWEFASCRELATLELPTDEVASLAFSPTETDLLAIGYRRGPTKLWDLAAKAPPTIFARGMVAESLAFSPDGKKLAFAFGRGAEEVGRVEVWDVETRTRDWLMPAHGEMREPALCVTFSTDGKLVASGGGDTKVRLWNAETGEKVGLPLAGHTAFVLAVKFSPDSRLLATTGVDSRVLVWDVATHLPRSELLGHRGPVKSLDFSPDGETLVSAADDSTIRSWSVETSRQTGILRGHTSGIHSLAFSTDGQLLVSVSNKTVKLWDALPHVSQDVFAEHEGWVESVVLTPDGRTVAVYDYHATEVKLWDVRSRRLLGILPQPDGHRNLAISPNGKLLASGGGADRTVQVWDLSKRKEIAVFRCDGNWMRLSFTADSRYLSAIAKGRLQLWSIASGRECELPTADSRSRVFAVASRNDELLTAQYQNGKVIVWDAKEGREVTSYPAEPGIRKMSFSGDGTLIAEAGGDGGVTLFDVKREEVIARLHGHTSDVFSVFAFTPDSKSLVTASRDGTVRLWSVDAGLNVLTLEHIGPVTGVSFSDDGLLMATCGADATVRLWPAASLSEADATWQTSTADGSR